MGTSDYLIVHVSPVGMGMSRWSVGHSHSERTICHINPHFRKEIKTMLSRRQFIEWCGRICLALGITSVLPNSAKAAVTQNGYHIPADYTM